MYYLLLSHYNNCCTKAPQCYVIRTLPDLSFLATEQFKTLSRMNFKWETVLTFILVLAPELMQYTDVWTLSCTPSLFRRPKYASTTH